MSLHKVTFYTDYTETVDGTEIWVRLPGTNGATWKLSDGAELEEIIPLEEPFIPGWYGVYRTDGSLYQVIHIFSKENLKRCEERHSPSALKRVSVTLDTPPAKPELQLGDVVRIKHAFEYNPHAGKLGSIVAHTVTSEYVELRIRVPLATQDPDMFETAGKLDD